MENGNGHLANWKIINEETSGAFTASWYSDASFFAMSETEGFALYVLTDDEWQLVDNSHSYYEICPIEMLVTGISHTDKLTIKQKNGDIIKDYNGTEEVIRHINGTNFSKRYKIAIVPNDVYLKEVVQ